MKLSVIVPVYKVEEYLDSCVKSILANTEREEVEIILIDDGSPDKCQQMVDDYAARYDNIIALHQENAGQGEARNNGIKVAKGDYIYFLDSDDELSPNFYGNISPHLNGENQAILTTKIVELDCNNGKETVTTLSDITNADATTALSNYVLQVARLGYALYKRNVLVDNGLTFSNRRDICEDDSLIFRYFEKVDRFAVIEESMYIYKVNRQGSTVNIINSKVLVSTIEETLKIVAQIDKSRYNNPSQLRTKYANRLLDYMLKYRYVDNKAIAGKISTYFAQNYAFLKCANANIAKFLFLRKVVGGKLCLRIMGKIRKIANKH